MNPLSLSGPASEPTPEGEQMLVPGVVPITTRDRLAALVRAPLTPSKPQKPMITDYSIWPRAISSTCF
jgi:hypothetical protein